MFWTMSTYLVIWVMCVQKHFTESKNINLLPRYDVSKLAHTRTFLTIALFLYRKIVEKNKYFLTLFVTRQTDGQADEADYIRTAEAGWVQKGGGDFPSHSLSIV